MVRNGIAALALGFLLLAPTAASALPLRGFDRGPDRATIDLEELSCCASGRRGCLPRGVAKLLERLVNDEHPFARLRELLDELHWKRLQRLLDHFDLELADHGGSCSFRTPQFCSLGDGSPPPPPPPGTAPLLTTPEPATALLAAGGLLGLGLLGRRRASTGRR